MNFKAKRIPKPWGHELLIALVPNKYAGKLLVINGGERLSLQYHRRKHESLYVLEGKLTLQIGARTRIAKPGSAFTVAPGTRHRFEARHGRVTLIEVSTTQLDDVVRLKDDYGRSGEK